MRNRRQRPEDSGVADQNVELAPAPVNRGAESVEGLEILDVARNQRRLAAQLADGVVQFFERALGAGKRDDMGAALRQFERDGATNAARGAGDKAMRPASFFSVSDIFRQFFLGIQPVSASRDNWARTSTPLRSVSVVG